MGQSKPPARAAGATPVRAIFFDRGGQPLQDGARVSQPVSEGPDIRALKRVKDAMAAGRPLPMALREQRVWGLRERLFERVLPRLTTTALDNLLHSAHLVDGIVKGLKAPDWPTEGWQALHRLAMQLCQECSPQQGAAPRAKMTG